jgi:inorganic pyrophosphatase
MPGELQKVMEWFRDYKIPAGKPENKYGFDAKCMEAAFTKDVIEECHGFWQSLKDGSRDNDVKVCLE